MMTLREAVTKVEIEAIAQMALDTQLGSYEDAIHLVEDILPAKDAAKVVNVILEWASIDMFDGESYQLDAEGFED